MMNDKKVVLSARDIVVKFRVRERVLTAIRNVSLDLYDGETLAIVGESGSGKSVLTKTFTGMLETNGSIPNGEIHFEGSNLLDIKNDKEWEAIRGKKIATVFQDPMTSLNQIRTIGSQITEVIEKHQGKTKQEAKEIAINLMERVGIKDSFGDVGDIEFLRERYGLRSEDIIAAALRVIKRKQEKK